MFCPRFRSLRKTKRRKSAKTHNKINSTANADSDSEIFLHNADFLALTFSKTPANAGKNI